MPGQSAFESPMSIAAVYSDPCVKHEREVEELVQRVAKTLKDLP